MNRLNLLPEDIKKQIALSKKNAKLYQLLMKLIMLSVCLSVFVAVLGFYVKSKQDVVAGEIASIRSSSSEKLNYEKLAKDFYARLNLVKETERTRINWYGFLNEIAANVPPNVKIDSLDLPTDSKNRGKISGYALSDKDISLFRDLLEKSTVFEYVDIETITEGSDPKVQGRKIRKFSLTTNVKYSEVK